MKRNSELFCMWILIFFNLLKSTQAETDTLDDNAVKMNNTAMWEIISLSTVFAIIGLALLIFFCFAKSPTFRKVITLNCLQEHGGIFSRDDERQELGTPNSSNSSSSSSIYSIKIRDDEDPPPSYEEGLRSATPPPSFANLFPHLISEEK